MIILRKFNLFLFQKISKRYVVFYIPLIYIIQDRRNVALKRIYAKINKKKNNIKCIFIRMFQGKLNWSCVFIFCIESLCGEKHKEVMNKQVIYKAPAYLLWWLSNKISKNHFQHTSQLPYFLSELARLDGFKDVSVDHFSTFNILLLIVELSFELLTFAM
jgi:hypothetical protein